MKYKLDNRPENIELMSFSEHSRLHAKEKVVGNIYETPELVEGDA